MSDHNQYIKPVPAWLWLFALTSLAAFAGLLFYLDQYEKGHITTDRVTEIKNLFSTSENPLNKSQDSTQPEKTKKPNFEFYSLLRDLEVVIPDKADPQQDTPVNDPKSVAPDTEQTQVANTPKDSLQLTPPSPKYFIQAGSFKQYNTADRMKANLALLGIQARIESATIPNSGVWHRVRVGPFTTKQEMAKYRKILRTNGIESIMVKLKI